MNPTIMHPDGQMRLGLLLPKHNVVGDLGFFFMKKDKIKLGRDLNIKLRTIYAAGITATFGGRRYEEYASKLKFGELYKLFNAKPVPIVTPSLNFNSGADLTGLPIIPMEQGPIVVDPDYGSGTADGTVIEISTSPNFGPGDIVYTYDGPPVETKNIPASSVGSAGDPLNPPTYYMRVRNKVGNYVSPWSDVVNFKLVVNNGIEKPVIQTEDNRVIHASQMTPTGGWSPIHTASDWEVSLDPGFSSTVFTSYNDTINLTDILLDTLASGNTYHVRVRYYAGGMVSEWSDPYSFHAVAFIYPPTIVYPTFHDNGTNSIVVSEYDNINTPYPNPEMIVEYRYSDDAGSTWTAWTLLNYSYNEFGVYDVYLEQVPAGGTRRFEVRCRYRKYTGPNPLDYVYSGYSNTYWTEFSDSDYIGTGGYLTQTVDTTYHYHYRHSVPLLDAGASVDTTRYEIYRNRELTDLVATWTGTIGNATTEYLITSPYWQRQLYGSINHWLPSEVLYIRARKYNSVSTETCTWSDVKALDLVTYGLPATPTMIDPYDGQTDKSTGYLNMSTVNPSDSVTNPDNPMYVLFRGLEPQLGTGVDANGNPTGLIERFPYYYTNALDAHAYMTGELEPNTTYHVRMRYLFDPMPLTEQWTPTVTFTTGPNPIPRFSHLDTMTIGGSLGRGIPRNPMFYYPGQILNYSNTPYGAYACLMIVVEDLTTGEEKINVNPEGRYVATDIFAIQSDKDSLEINTSYRVWYRFARTLSSGVGVNARAEKWRFIDFNVTRESNYLEDITVGFTPPSGIRYPYVRQSDGMMFMYISRRSSSGLLYRGTPSGTWTQIATLRRRWDREAVIWNYDMNRLELCGHDQRGSLTDGDLIDLDTGIINSTSRPYSNFLPANPTSCALHAVRGVYDPTTSSSFVFGGGGTTPKDTVTKWANTATAPTFPTTAVLGVWFGAIDTDRNGVIYRFAGTATSTTLGNNNNRCFKYNTNTNTWTEVQALPQVTKALAGVYCPAGNSGSDGFLLLKNGFSSTGTARQPYVMWYDNATDTWDYIWKVDAISKGLSWGWYNPADGFVYPGDNGFNKRFKLGE